MNEKKFLNLFRKHLRFIKKQQPDDFDKIEETLTDNMDKYSEVAWTMECPFDNITSIIDIPESYSKASRYFTRQRHYGLHYKMWTIYDDVKDE